MKKQHHHFIRLLYLLTFILLSQTAAAQQPLNGRVLNKQTQEPVSGASVRLLGSGALAQSDEQGNFKITATQGADTLMVSYTGAVTVKHALSSSGTLNALTIYLDFPSTQLQEVIISTGYQQIPKERATGSFSTISGKQLSQQVSTTILERLEAASSGISIDRSTGLSGKMMVRGLSSLGGPRAALIILDNNPYEGDPGNINPNDIESVTILKDAAAASIWGARAGNGVIVITTKKGRFDQPLTIELNVNSTIGQKPDLGYIKQMSSEDFITVEKLLFANNFYRSQINSSSKPALSPVVELLIKRSAASPQEQSLIDQQIRELSRLDIRDEFRKYFYEPSLNQQYALNLKAGTGKQAWLISAGYDHNKTNLDGRYKRISFRGSHTLQLSEKLSLSAGMLLTRSNSQSGKPGYGQITAKGFNPFPYARFADAQGRPVAMTKDYRSTFLESLHAPGLTDWSYYPLTDYQHNSTTSDLQDLTANAALDYRLIPGLKASLQYLHQKQSTSGESLMDKDSYFARNLYNLYSALNPDGSATSALPGGGILDLSAAEIRSSQWRAQLSLDKNWNAHQLNLLGGAEVRETVTTGNTYRTFGYNPENLSYGQVDLSKAYPTFINASANFIPDNRSFTGQRIRFVSLYANGAYTFRQKYILSASLRRDASNLFGVSVNNKWKPLWSAGIAWDLAREFFSGSKAVNALKLRATYGLSGNTDAARVALTTLRSQGNSIYTNTPYYIFDQYANPELKWETVSQFNTGIDFSLLENRIRGSLDAYVKTSSDLFGVVPVDYTTGVGFQVQKNVAKIQGKGLDLVLSWANTTGILSWSSELNLSYHKDVTKQYHHTDLRAAGFMNQGGPRVSAIAGQAVYGIYAYRWGGLDPQSGLPQGYLQDQLSKDYRGITGTGIKISDVRYFGSALPVYYGSLGNTLSYKAFSLEARLLFKLGYYFRRSTIDYSTLNTQWNGHSDFASRWQKPGDESRTDIPALVYPIPSGMSAFYLNAEPFVSRADHIRLQYLTLSYRLSPAVRSKLPFSSLLFYSSAANLGLLWRANKNGIDPDYANSYSLTTPPMTIALGIKANF